MHVLVTGASGFIGAQVAREAREMGHTVRAVSRRPANLGDGIEAIRLDLRDEPALRDAMAGIDAIIHCAGSLTGGPAEQRADTIDSTTVLLQASASSAVSCFVHVSTLALYDVTAIADGASLTESSPLDVAPDRNAYVNAKSVQEDAVRAASLARGWRWAVLRPGIVHGPGRLWFHHLGARIAPRAWIGLAPDSALPLCHVRNCARAAVLALGAATTAGIVANLVDDDPPPRGEYLKRLAGLAVPPPFVLYLPWRLLRALAAAVGGVDRLLGSRLPVPDLLHPAALAARCKPLRYPNAHAKSALGWAPAPGLGKPDVATAPGNDGGKT